MKLILYEGVVANYAQERVEIKTTGDYLDEELLNDMEKNKETPYIEKEEVLKTIQNILNEDQAGYTN